MSDSLWPHCCNMPDLSVLHYLPEFAQTHIYWVGDAIQLSHPLSSSSLLSSIFPNIRAFSSESTLCIRWPNYQSFSVSMSLLNEYSGLISFRIDWFDLFVVQGSLKSSPVPQFESISSSAFSSFYGPGLTSVHDYWETVPLTVRALVGKLMFLLFNMLSRFVSFPSKEQASFNFSGYSHHPQWFWSPRK